MKIKLVIATRENQDDFFSSTATGKSLATRCPPHIELRVFPNNQNGLPVLYNKVIRECVNDPSILVFAHDDLHLLDYFWFNRVYEGLSYFDIIGLAGNRRRVPKQPCWACVDNEFTCDAKENLSGVVGHGSGFPLSNFGVYGPPRQQVKLLDGLFLASKSETLIAHQLFFDEQFSFHFYDLDFCRQAELKNITCGTWDIALVHESRGAFGSQPWQSSYKKYLDKWGE